MATFESLKGEYARLLATMTILPEKLSAADAVARKILAGRARYEAVSKSTGVPWRLIGVIHAMECGLSFKQHLHNGDPLTARTRQVPKGRPTTGTPPFTWEESAIDALRYDGLDKVRDWTPERIAYELEGYNGWGYRSYHPSVLSPYLWSYSNHYTRGKYVQDGKWDASAVSGQCGAIVLLRRVEALEGKPAQTSTSTTAAVTTAAVAVGTGAVAATVTWWDRISSFFSSIFGG